MYIINIIIRLICYLALAFVASGIAAMVYVTYVGGCLRLDEGSVQCISPFYETLGSYGLGVVMVSLFTGLPAILAIAGLIFLIRDLWRWRRRRRENATAIPNS
jgi:hypothetical protein